MALVSRNVVLAREESRPLCEEMDCAPPQPQQMPSDPDPHQGFGFVVGSSVFFSLDHNPFVCFKFPFPLRLLRVMSAHGSQTRLGVPSLWLTALVSIILLVLHCFSLISFILPVGSR